MQRALPLFRAASPMIRAGAPMTVRQLPMGQMVLARCFGGGGFLEPAEVTARVVEVVSNFEKVDSSKVAGNTKFADLDLDSLDVVEVVLAIEEEFALEIPDAEADKIVSIADAVAFISSHPQAK